MPSSFSSLFSSSRNEWGMFRLLFLLPQEHSLSSSMCALSWGTILPARERGTCMHFSWGARERENLCSEYIRYEEIKNERINFFFNFFQRLWSSFLSWETSPILLVTLLWLYTDAVAPLCSLFSLSLFLLLFVFLLFFSLFTSRSLICLLARRSRHLEETCSRSFSILLSFKFNPVLETHPFNPLRVLQFSSTIAGLVLDRGEICFERSRLFASFLSLRSRGWTYSLESDERGPFSLFFFYILSARLFPWGLFERLSFP